MPESLIEAMRASPCLDLQLADDERVQLARVYLAMALHGLGERDGATRALDAIRGAICEDPMAGWRTLNALGRAEEFFGH